MTKERKLLLAQGGPGTIRIRYEDKRPLLDALGKLGLTRRQGVHDRHLTKLHIPALQGNGSTTQFSITIKKPKNKWGHLVQVNIEHEESSSSREGNRQRQFRKLQNAMGEQGRDVLLTINGDETRILLTTRLTVVNIDGIKAAIEPIEVPIHPPNHIEPGKMTVEKDHAGRIKITYSPETREEDVLMLDQVRGGPEAFVQKMMWLGGFVAETIIHADIQNLSPYQSGQITVAGGVIANKS